MSQQRPPYDPARQPDPAPSDPSSGRGSTPAAGSPPPGFASDRDPTLPLTRGYGPSTAGSTSRPSGYGQPGAPGSSRPPSGSPPSGYGARPTGYGQPPSGYGSSPSGYGPRPPSYGPPPAGYGQPPAGYGQPPSGYGPPPAGYGQPPSGYGQPPAGYGQPPAGYGQPPAGYGPPPARAPGDTNATQPATQPWVAPPAWAGPGALGSTPPGGTSPTGTTWTAGGGWDPAYGPQAGTSHGGRPPTPRRGVAAGGQGRTPPAVIVGTVIGVAALFAVAVWFMLLRPGDSGTAFVSPTPRPTVVATSPPSATATPEPTDEPYGTATPEPTRFRNPTFSGLKIDDAQSLADRTDVLLEVTYEVTDEVEPDTVMAQDPPPGRDVLPGDVVRLTVAARLPTVAIPDLRGFAEEDAIATLVGLQLTVGARAEAYDAEMPAGLVVRTDPRGGLQVPRDTSVDYLVSLGPEPTPVPTAAPTERPMPEFVGLSRDEAQAAADEAGLSLDVVTEETLTVTPGSVISQDPAPGTPVLPGQTVRIVVAVRPATVVVPDVRGLPSADAVSALVEAGLQPGIRSESFDPLVAAGLVTRTDPRAGVAVAPGTEIDYLVSLGTEPAATPEPTAETAFVPDLVGLTLADAQAAAADARLVLTVEERETLDSPPLTVLEQDPAPDTQLRVGEGVRLVVAVRPGTVVVPALRGLPEQDAIAALLGSALVPGERTERHHASVPAGAVIRSDPAGGTIVAVDTIVDFAVSLGPEPILTPEPTSGPLTLPELVGLTVEDAQAFADGNGLLLTVVDRETADAPAGTILEQDPPPGSPVVPGDTLRVLVARSATNVTVPDLRGLSEADGLALLTSVGLQSGRRIDRYNGDVPAEAIVRTDPVAGTPVAPGSVVDYVVSRGPEPAAAPQLVGLPIDDARSVAAASGLSLEITEVDEGSSPPGTVLAQDPDVGQPLAGNVIRVTVARSTSLVAVPDLSGLSEGDGIAQLAGVGLRPGRRIDRYNDSIPADAIVRTDPPAGTGVPRGTVIDYVVSRGPESQVVPDLQGLALRDAQGRADGAGLALEVSYQATRDADPGTVISQDPAPGTPSDGSRSVRVVVAQAPSTTQVPKLHGLTEQDALASLRDAGLRPGGRSERYHPDIEAGLVLGTVPKGGTEVEPGSSIDYTVSLGPEPAGQPTPEPTPEVTIEPVPNPTTDPGNGGDVDPATAALIDEIVGQVPATRELDQLAGIPYRALTPRQLHRELKARFDEQNPAEVVAGQEATFKRLGLLPPDADLRALTLALLESQVAAYYDPQTDTLAVVARDDAFDAAERMLTSHEVDRALVDQHWDLEALRIPDPSQGDRAMARRSLQEGDAVALMIDWAGQNLSADELAAIGPGLPADPALLDAAPLLVRRQFQFPAVAGSAFVNALRSVGGWAAVDAAWEKPPASTEQILHPERYPSDKPVKLVMPDVASVLGDGWVVSDEQTLGELGIGVWLDDGQEGSPNAWAADGWGGDKLVSLDGPDGSWAVVWQTAWDSDTDADEFSATADVAMADLPAPHAVLRGVDITGGAPSPSLVIVASDQGVLDSIEFAVGLGG